MSGHKFFGLDEPAGLFFTTRDVYEHQSKYDIRPCEEIVEKYCLACNYDERFGGDLSHIVVMQHVTKDRIDAIVEAIKESLE